MHTLRLGSALLLLAIHTSLFAQGVDPLPAAPDSAAADSVRARIYLDARPGRFPVDDVRALLRFMPGFIDGDVGAPDYRVPGSSPTTYIDGVPLTSFVRTAVEPPRGAIRTLSVSGGGPTAARVGATQIEYTTARGGDEWVFDGGVHSDALSPGAWDQTRSRFHASAAGPIPALSGLRFSITADLLGQRHRQLPEGGPQTFVISGVDTTFVLPATSGGSVDVVVPAYSVVDASRLPLGNTDRSGVMTSLTWDNNAAQYALRYLRDSDRSVHRDVNLLYNPDSWRGEAGTSDVLSVVMRRPFVLGADIDAMVSYQRHGVTTGMIDPVWASTNTQPAFGIATGSLDFLADPADWTVTDALLNGLRSGVIPYNTVVFNGVAPGRVPVLQTVSGVSGTLRLNPYGARTTFPISGFGTDQPAIDWVRERRWHARAAVSRASGAVDFVFGGELDRSNVEGMSVPLQTGVPTAFREKPTSSAAFIQAHAFLSGLRVDAGVRADHRATDAKLPRVPGFIVNLPDSLRGDAYELVPGDGPWQDRLQRVEDCGGAATVVERTNPVTGAAVCMSNFQEVPGKTDVSPRVAVSYDRLGRFRPYGSWGVYTRPSAALLSQALQPFAGAVRSWHTDPVRESIGEVGLRVQTVADSWVDVRMFLHDVRNDVVVRLTEFSDPNTGAPLFIRIPVNGNPRETMGIDISTLHRFGTRAGVLAGVTLSETEGGPEGSLSDPIRAQGIAWMDFGSLTPMLDDLTMHVTAAYQGGAAFTRLQNEGVGSLVGRINTVQTGSLAEELNSSRLPSRKDLDLRIAKGFRVAGTHARLVADLRNPLGFDNVHTVFAETGTTTNMLYRNMVIGTGLMNFIGTGEATDMVIDEQPENELNRYMLRRAEERFGNGDGVFSVAEMTSAVESFTDLTSGAHYLRDSARELRLGIEITF